MKSSTLTALVLTGLLILAAAPTRAEEGKVLAEFKPAAGAETTAISWYNTNETPGELKIRDVAQTFRASADGEIAKLVFPIEKISTAGRPQGDVGNFAFTVTFYDHTDTVPATTFVSRNNRAQPAKAEMSADGQSFIVNLDDPVLVLSGQIYTFALGWQGADPGNRISLQQSPGTEDTFRWHRQDRGSWTKAKNSLEFTALGK